MTYKITHETKVKIPEISATRSIDKDNDYIEVSDRSTKNSYRYKISRFSSNQNIVNNSVANRYNTGPINNGGNNLTSTDLLLFSGSNGAYLQHNNSSKKVWFETHPIVDSTADVSSLEDAQLITKNGLYQFENHLATRDRYPCSSIPAFNWENEQPGFNPKDGATPNSVSVITEISEFIPTTENEARATYKFEYNSATSNIVRLDNLKRDGANSPLNGSFYYSVIGLVSVKSILPDQKSGTIYLEAKDANDESADWITIDSAVFKFLNETTSKSSPGTYVVLNGYLSSDLETRLRLNLHSQGYSMNIASDRLINNALVNNHVNTFVGFVYAPYNTDPMWEDKDENEYYCVNYRPPSQSHPAYVLHWTAYTDPDLDPGEYELDYDRPLSDPVIDPPAPPQFRHMRWADKTFPGREKLYKPGEIVMLSPDTTTKVTSTNTYEMTVEAIYGQILYDVIYRSGKIISWEQETLKDILPQYNYMIRGPHEANAKVVPGTTDYYRQLCWIDVTNQNRVRPFNRAIPVLDDSTTRQAPGQYWPVDPEIHRQLILEAKYIPVRYQIRYYPGEAETAISGSWQSFLDANEDGKGYAYKYDYKLCERLPKVGQGSTNPRMPGFISTADGRTLLHAAWEITYKGVKKQFRPDEHITLTDDFIQDEDRDAWIDSMRTEPWEISAKAIYKPPYNVVLHKFTGGEWSIFNHQAEPDPVDWDPINYGNLDISSFIPEPQPSEITITDPSVTIEMVDDPENPEGPQIEKAYFILPWKIESIKNCEDITAVINSNAEYIFWLDKWTATGSDNTTKTYYMNTDITSRRVDLNECLQTVTPEGIKVVHFYSDYRIHNLCTSSSSVISRTPTIDCDNQKDGGSCGSRLYKNTGKMYVYLNIDLPSSFKYIKVNIVGNCYGCHHEWPSHHYITIYFDSGGSISLNGSQFGWQGHEPHSGYEDFSKNGIRFKRLDSHTYYMDIYWYMHHMQVRNMRVAKVCF